MSSGVGYYGKIAALGDFVRHGVAPDFVAAWDAFAQAGMTESRAMLGDRWFEHYQGAPLWRFSLAPGVCGRAGVAGVMMPSMDRVGRLFPLVLVASAEADPLGDEAALHAMEEAALDTLDPDGGRAALDAAVAGLAAPQGGARAMGSHWQARSGDGILDLRRPGLPDPSLFATFLDLAVGRWSGVPA